MYEGLKLQLFILHVFTYCFNASQFDTIFFFYSCFVAYFRTKMDKCRKLKIIMDESDNQAETKMPFDPRHRVGREN